MFDDVGVLDFVMALLAVILVLGTIRVVGQMIAGHATEAFKSDPCFKKKKPGEK